MATSRRYGKIGYINGMRGIAILMVLAHHILQPLQSPVPASDTSALTYFLVQPFIYNGWLGVNIFFVLSGFVLYLPFAKQQAVNFEPFVFLKKRAQRLLPLYYVNVSVCLAMLFGEPIFWVAANAVIFLFALLPTPVVFFPPNNPPLWSLGIEIWFSVLFPILLILTRTRGVVLVLGLLTAAAFLFHALATAAFHEEGKYLNDVADTIPGRLGDFCIGMLAAHFWFRRNGRDSLRGPIGYVLTLATVACIYLALLLSTARYVGELPPEVQTLANLLLASGTAMMILLLQSVPDLHFIRAVLEIRLLQLIGMMCFSIYIWHWQILHAFNLLLGDQLWVRTPVIAVYLAVLSIVSICSYRFIEFRRQPARKIFLMS
ncbi:acyltransferase [Paracoccus aurantiacus]|uniref:Acyltransferase n=1 Tax=Paracoccus aurantiacus TaxID=2599412 RepID=A0A5C6SCD8_9RHOB|nr:acyltransferase [Paracoccus aurantiacus]TXB71255.1 acyltransferase [Paracoccus aurantiacus]